MQKFKEKKYTRTLDNERSHHQLDSRFFEFLIYTVSFPNQLHLLTVLVPLVLLCFALYYIAVQKMSFSLWISLVNANRSAVIK